MSESSATFDSVLDLCQHRYRRIILAKLAAEQQSVTLDELAQAILKDDKQMSITEASEDVIAEIRTELHHVHLPKLAEKEVIATYPDRQFVELSEQFEQIQPTVSAILDADPTLEVPVELKT